MRPLVDAARLELLFQEFGREAKEPVRLYLVGGASALLRGWRRSTIDVDLRLEPESTSLLRGFSEIKERLNLSLELASPLDFLPELPSWRDRSPFLKQVGSVSIFEFDFYSQALAKIQRGHAQDVLDVRSMFADGLVEASRLLELFAAIEPELYRFPAVNAGALREDVERAARSSARDSGDVAR